jgi:hypothetical protein
MAIYPYHISRKNAIELEEKLLEKEIKISKDSAIYRLGFDLLETAEQKFFSTFTTSEEDKRGYYRRVTGFNDFISRILKFIDDDEKFSIMKSHLKLLNEASIIQNTSSSIDDSATNKLFELYIALLCFPNFNDVALDHAISSKGDNPDIIFNYKERKWSIACKTPHSFEPKKIFENIEKGISQIENAEVDLGFVLINLKNIIDHDKLWPVKKINNNLWEIKQYDSYDTIWNNLLYATQEWVNKIKLEVGNDINLLYENNKKAIPVTVFFVETTACTINDMILQPLFTCVCVEPSKICNETIEIINQLNYSIRH